MGRKRAVETPDEQPADSAPKQTVKKADVVRAALAEGIDSPNEGVAFIQKRFGVEMRKLPMWTSYKSQEQGPAGEGDRRRPAEARAALSHTPCPGTRA